MKRTFGEFEFDEANEILRENNQTIELRPKSTHLLKLLLNRPNDVISKDELMAAVWPGKVVEEQGVFQIIRELREVFGAEAIKTYPKKGYAWVLPETKASSTWYAKYKRHLYISGFVSALLCVTVVSAFTFIQPDNQVLLKVEPTPLKVSSSDSPRLENAERLLRYSENLDNLSYLEALVSSYLDLGEWFTAYHYSEELITKASDQQRPYYEFQGLILLAEVQMMLHQADQAQRTLQRAETIAKVHAEDYYTGMIHEFHGLFMVEDDNYAEARSSLLRAATLAHLNSCHAHETHNLIQLTELAADSDEQADFEYFNTQSVLKLTESSFPVDQEIHRRVQSSVLLDSANEHPSLLTFGSQTETRWGIVLSNIAQSRLLQEKANWLKAEQVLLSDARVQDHPAIQLELARVQYKNSEVQIDLSALKELHHSFHTLGERTFALEAALLVLLVEEKNGAGSSKLQFGNYIAQFGDPQWVTKHEKSLNRLGLKLQ